jgi:DNA (cytosine-5)-methyltransferase 1
MLIGGMMSKPRLLDLFCGAGGCTRGYQLAGFHVTGVDAKSFGRYVGDDFHQGDALDYLNIHGHEFDAIHASPPCQSFSSMKSMPNAKKHPDLVTPCRDLLKKSGKPYVIENVVGCPLINPTMLCGTMFGLGTGDAELRRHRLFETNWPLVLPMGMHCKHGVRARTVTVIGGHGQPGLSIARRKKQRVISVHDSSGRGHDNTLEHKLRKSSVVAIHGSSGGSSTRSGLIYFSSAERNEAMGIDWMKGGEISQAIPPAYCLFIGERLMKYL